MPTMGPSDGSVIIDIDGNQKPFDEALEKSKEKANKFGKEVDERFKKTAKLAAAGFVAMGVAATKFGSDLEQSLANASTLFGDVDVDMANLKNQILEVSDATGETAKSLSDGLYQALSAGIPITENAAEATKFLKDNAILAKAGFTDVTTAIDATTSVMNTYGLGLKDVDKIHGILIQTQNKGKTTIDEFGRAIANVIPSAKAANVSFEQVGAAMASLTARGVKTNVATTQLRALFDELSKSGTKANKAFVETYENTQLAGESFAVLSAKGKPLNEILNDMSSNASKNGLSLKDMFGSVEAGSAALLLSGENSKSYTENLKAMGDTAGVVNDAFNKVDQTLQSKFNKTTQRLINLLIRLFDVIEPVLSGLLDLVDAMLRFDTEGQILVVTIGTLTALIVAYNIQQLLASKSLTVWTGISKIATIATTSLGVAFEFLLGPIGLVIIAVGAVIAIGILLYKNWDQISKDMSRLGKWLGDSMTSAFDAITSAVSNLIGFLTGTFLGVWESVWNGALNIFTSIWKGLVEFFKLPFNAVIEGINAFIRALNLIRVPDWVPGIGGAGFNIPEIPKLAKGGVAFGETMAMIGDNPDASINPEVVAPINVLKSMMMDVTGIQNNRQTINAHLTGYVDMDGEKVGTIILKHEDDNRSFQ